MSVFGVDYAWGRPGAAALKRAGARFVCRYLSHDPTKDLSAAEAAELAAAGIALVVVWETTARRALDGRGAGAVDARTAERAAAALGMPGDRPIYFAADWDATPGQQDEINAYLDGAASVIGRARVGLYGGYWPLSRALDAGRARWGWQTYAWSGGRWDARAHIQQYSIDHRINGVGVDYNRAVKDDFGQWRPAAGGPPAPDWQEALMRALPTLGPGDHGEHVQSVQGLLQARSHPEVAIDGDYGPITRAAVMDLQEWGGVTVDGIVGRETWPVLLRVN